MESATIDTQLPAHLSLQPAEIQHLDARLRENVELSQVERITLSKIPNAIEYCNARIDQLRSLQFAFEGKRNQLEEYASRYASFSAPIRKLSAEILLEIFRYVAEGTMIGAIVYGWKQELRDLPSISISHVSSHWRKLVLAAEELWTTFEQISLHYNWADRHQHRVLNEGSIIQHYLSHSGSKGLIIRNLDHYAGGDDVHPGMVLLAESSSRWIEVHIDNYGGAIQHHGFPLLRQLSLNLTLLYTPDLESVFLDAPKLRTVELSGIGDGDAPYEHSSLQMPWSQLTSLTLRDAETEFYTDVLPQCTQLEHLEVHPPRDVEGDDSPEDFLRGQQISLPISSLKLDFANKPYRAVFNALELPSLTSIGVQQFEKGWSRFSSFVIRTNLSNRLTAFSLSLTTISDIELIRILQLLPALTDVSLEEEYGGANIGQEPTEPGFITDTFIAALDPSGGSISTPILPHLANLTLTLDNRQRILQDATIVKMLTARRTFINQNIHILQSIKLDLMDRRVFDPLLLSPLRHLKRTGLRIRLWDQSGSVF